MRSETLGEGTDISQYGNFEVGRRGTNLRILHLLQRIKNYTLYHFPSCFSQNNYRRPSIDQRRSIDFGKVSFQQDENRLEETCLSLNPYNHLSTKRHKFTSKLPVYLESNRKKWMVFDQLTKTNVVLHRLGEKANRLSEYVEITQEQADRQIGEMTKKQFKEVVLMRCARKCPYTLLCFGYALDRYQNVYISTEFFCNLTLSQYQNQLPGKVLDEIAAKSVSTQILRALDYLHAIRIVHGDVVASNILIKSISDVDINDQHSIDGFHVKLFDFRKSRDADLAVKDDNAQSTCQRCNFTQTKATSTSFDIKCLGLLIFSSLQNVSPWDKECMCDQNFAKRYPDYSKHDGGDDETSMNEFHTFQRANTITKRFRKSCRHLRMKRNAYSENSNYGKLDEMGEKRSWRDFSPRFTNCLTKMLSPYIEDRVTASVLLRGGQYKSLFQPLYDDGHAWKKKEVNKIAPLCIKITASL